MLIRSASRSKINTLRKEKVEGGSKELEGRQSGHRQACAQHTELCTGCGGDCTEQGPSVTSWGLIPSEPIDRVSGSQAGGHVQSS